MKVSGSDSILSDNDNNIIILHDYMITIDYMISGHAIRKRRKKGMLDTFSLYQAMQKIPSS